MQMDQSMMESFKMTSKKVKEKRSGQMEVSLPATFKMERKKGMEFLNLLMVLYTKEVSILGKWKEKAKRLMWMGLCMKENLRTIEKMVKACVTGLTVETMKGISFQVNEMDLESTNGLTVEYTQELGKMENKTDEGNLHQVKMT